MAVHCLKTQSSKRCILVHHEKVKAQWVTGGLSHILDYLNVDTRVKLDGVYNITYIVQLDSLMNSYIYYTGLYLGVINLVQLLFCFQNRVELETISLVLCVLMLFS